jgi:methylmalonyl-CoA mutase N-terminal domain/subunit
MEGGDILFKQDQLDKIAAKKEKWAAKLEATVKKRPEREEQFATDSGFVIDTVYTPLNLKDMDYDADLGLPGEFPYTRGVQPNVYRGRLWTMRQYAGFGSAEETNARFRYLLEQGQTGLSCAFDLPTQIGYDSDHRWHGAKSAKWVWRSTLWPTWKYYLTRFP